MGFPLYIYSSPLLLNVFLITHPCETEINYNHASLISLEKQMTKKYLDSPASETLTPFVYQASQFIPANRQLEYSPQNQGLGVLITSQTQKLQFY